MIPFKRVGGEVQMEMGKKRSCCCLVFGVLALAVGSVVAFLLWARAPSIDFKGVAPPEDKSTAFEMKELSNFRFNLRLRFMVKNPNYVGATLKKIQAKGHLPEASSTQLGEGEMRDVFIPKQSETELLFPIQVDYVASKDKNLDTLFYIATKCGLLNEPRSQIKIKYTVTVSVKVVAVPVNLPAFDNDVDIDCPIPPGTKIPNLQYLAMARGLIGPGANPNLSENLRALSNQIPPEIMNQAAHGITNNPKLMQELSSLLGNSI
ncbi:hypothetical protein DSO57_1033221 [Entomophthora muscae]|uniref:Uncharacterized protein n=1 Tax=Entomophthora muscae TaxID=34485 RepID=A0ACC2TYX0_9FUNG|nr:hypothetical protein DSO57_1033221 [Entomophthora muscae]